MSRDVEQCWSLLLSDMGAMKTLEVVGNAKTQKGNSRQCQENFDLEDLENIMRFQFFPPLNDRRHQEDVQRCVRKILRALEKLWTLNSAKKMQGCGNQHQENTGRHHEGYQMHKEMVSPNICLTKKMLGHQERLQGHPFLQPWL